MKPAILFTAICAGLLSAAMARAGAVSGTYFNLTEGTEIDLTAEGTLDWIKFGNGENDTTTFLNTTKIGNPVFLPATLAPLGTPPVESTIELIAFTGGGLLNFSWTDGNFGMFNGTGPVDTVVTETILPPVSPEVGYPIGIGATFNALASAQPRLMDVYVQGFNADMLITATMSGGGSDSVVVSSPFVNPDSDSDNDYLIGRYRILYSGAGETLTVSIITQDPRTDGDEAAFANAGFFAATVMAVPEPSAFSTALGGAMLAAIYRRVSSRQRRTLKFARRSH